VAQNIHATFWLRTFCNTQIDLHDFSLKLLKLFFLLSSRSQTRGLYATAMSFCSSFRSSVSPVKFVNSFATWQHWRRAGAYHIDSCTAVCHLLNVSTRVLGMLFNCKDGGTYVGAYFLVCLVNYILVSEKIIHIKWGDVFKDVSSQRKWPDFWGHRVCGHPVV